LFEWVKILSDLFSAYVKGDVDVNRLPIL
jgi:hypothetical protein